MWGFLLTIFNLKIVKFELKNCILILKHKFNNNQKRIEALPWY
jgi:hypothetical protein